MSKADISSEWRVMKSPEGETFNLPPYADANTYKAKDYKFNSPAVPKPAKVDK